MADPRESSDPSLPASVMLAEHQRVSNLYLHNAAMGERRVTIHLLFVAGGGTLLLSLPQLMGLKPPADGSFFPIINQLILPGSMIVLLMGVEGVLTFKRLIERSVRATEYLRAINRINRFFADRCPEARPYFPWPCCDDRPAFGAQTLGVADLRDLVAVLNCLYAGILGADLILLVLGAFGVGSRNWLALAAIAFGLLVAIAAWRWHSYQEAAIVRRAERDSREKIAFPSSPQG